jgi:hypothetical protein
LALLLFAAAGLLLGDETLALNRAFVERIKNTATITTHLKVDEHLKSPHRISTGGNDGDIHMAGRDDTVELPLVAEIMNAAMSDETAALTDVRGTTAGKPVSVTGAWRIWFEHLGTAPQIQGNPVSAPTDSNPAHLFEIHPITNFDNIPVLKSFVPIPDYKAYDADRAFKFYEEARATIEANNTAIMIASGEGRYNYAEFYIEAAGSARAGTNNNGLFLLANVYGADSEEQVTDQPRRMVAINGTPPYDAMKSLDKGARLHVMGIPRVNLAEVSEIAAHLGTKTYSGTLPYEMIIVALLPE